MVMLVSYDQRLVQVTQRIKAQCDKKGREVQLIEDLERFAAFAKLSVADDRLIYDVDQGNGSPAVMSISTSLFNT
jgi:hypothetical protein